MTLVGFSSPVPLVDQQEPRRGESTDIAGKNKQHFLERVFHLQGTFPSDVSQRHFNIFRDIFPGIG